MVYKIVMIPFLWVRVLKFLYLEALGNDTARSAKVATT